MPRYDDRLFLPPAPVALVRLLNADTGATVEDVPMLLDTGSDLTLLPRSHIMSLGLPETGERVSLEAFDASISEETAVRATLFFTRKSFKGLFLPIDSEVGIIGRNILNQVRLIIDGPASNWDEFH